MSDIINSKVSLADSIKDFGSKELKGIYNTPALSNLSTTNINNLQRINADDGDIKVENVFHVAGNLDNKSLPELNKILKLSSEYTIDKINKAGRRGRKVQEFM